MTELAPFTPDPSWSKFKLAVEKRKYQEILEKRATELDALTKPDMSQFLDMVPDVSEDLMQKRVEIDDRQSFIDKISILDLYSKLSGKSPKKYSGQTNGIMGFCVAPDHDNTNTEAMQMDSSKNTWNCHACDEGGGVLAMSAFSMGMKNVGKGKLRDKDFALAERNLLEKYGWSYEKEGGKTVAKSPAQQLLDRKAARENEEDLKEALKKEKAPVATEKDESGVAEVISITRATDDIGAQSALPTFDWEKITTLDTPLWHYMEACRINSVPEQFHFFNAMMLVGLTAGKNVSGPTGSPFYANISPILIGNSGSGKSMSWKPVREVLREAIPFRCHTVNDHSGVVVAHGPGSGEDLMDVFVKAEDVNGKPVTGLKRVKAVISYGEVSHFINKANSRNSVLENAIQELYDSLYEVGVRSRTGGKTEAKEPFFCLMSTSQPKVIGKTFSTGQVANGLAGRLDFVTGTYKKPDPFQNEAGDLSKAILHFKSLTLWSSMEVRHLEWSDEAAALWAEFHEKNLVKILMSDETDIQARIDLKIKKYALIFAINEMHEKIERSDLEKAVYLFDYVIGVLDFIGGAIGKSSRNEMSEKVFQVTLEYYKKNEKPITLREIKRKLERRHPEWEDGDYLTTVKNLIELGEIVADRVKPARGPEKITYTPAAEAL